MISLSQVCDELVHHATGHSHEIIFGPAGEADDFEGGEGNLIQSLPAIDQSNLQCRRGTESRLAGHITRDPKVRTGKVKPRLFQEVRDTSDVIAPPKRRVRLDSVQRKLQRAGKLFRGCPHLPIFSLRGSHTDTAIHGHRQNPAFVVIRMLSDQVHAARRRLDDIGIPPIGGAEGFSNRHAGGGGSHQRSFLFLGKVSANS